MEAAIPGELWKAHWKNLEKLHSMMRDCQKVADQIARIAADIALDQEPTARDSA
ncbi:MAG: hypothetical protein M5U09_27875 [Gammaproteobacteria bacterium]|nr:hypothetical protein [Gammaproteobacteria bacterium]